MDYHPLTRPHKRTRNAASQELARKRIVKQRGLRCEWCGETRLIELHHIKRAVDGGTFDNDNLLLLCEDCHLKAHGKKRRKPRRKYAISTVV